MSTGGCAVQVDPADMQALAVALSRWDIDLGLADVWDMDPVLELLCLLDHCVHILVHANVMGWWPGVALLPLPPLSRAAAMSMLRRPMWQQTMQWLPAQQLFARQPAKVQMGKVRRVSVRRALHALSLQPELERRPQRRRP